MVTRDRVELARRAVSCFAAQTWPNLELVVVDDGMQDPAPMLEQFSAQGAAIRLVRPPADEGRTLGDLRNLAIRHATGDWCIQWDDDEWYHPTRVERQVRAADDRSVAVALRWTLVHVESPRHGRLSFRADTGFATPGTVLHRTGVEAYPPLRRGEDSVFLRRLRAAGPVTVLGAESSHLFVRCFHGSNTWDEDHFVRRLHRRPLDWPAYATAKWVHRDLRRHRAFTLEPAERDTIDQLLAYGPRDAVDLGGGT
jgi:glycosyltransferase involved in cell wall biosynthesis